jgi:rhodanese-related sulfurtransferase
MFDFFKNILGNTSNNLAEIIAKGALLVDVRTPTEFASGSAEGAINIPLDTLSR